MNILRRYKYPFVVFLLGLLIVSIGGIFKILHHANADVFLTVGLLLQCISFLYAIIILFISTSNTCTL
jgi:hypothetical protein